MIFGKDWIWFTNNDRWFLILCAPKTSSGEDFDFAG